MIIHREPGDTLVAEKILVTFDKVKRGPELMSTRGRHNAQYMSVQGRREPAFAIIDIEFEWVRRR